MCKLILLTLTISLMSCSAFKKKEKEVRITEVPINSDNSTNKGDEIFVVVEKMPEFPGGKKVLENFIQTNLRYPKKHKSGNVYAQFIIEKDGSITDTKIIRGLSPVQDKEVLRLISIMPNWICGKQRGKPVRVRLILPVKF